MSYFTGSVLRQIRGVWRKPLPAFANFPVPSAQNNPYAKESPFKARWPVHRLLMLSWQGHLFQGLVFSLEIKMLNIPKVDWNNLKDSFIHFLRISFHSLCVNLGAVCWGYTGEQNRKDPYPMVPLSYKERFRFLYLLLCSDKYYYQWACQILLWRLIAWYTIKSNRYGIFSPAYFPDSMRTISCSAIFLL